MITPVSFELAKLLKEKGFDKRTSLVWLFSLGKTHLREMHLSLELNDAEYNAPTIAEVVMWLYEKHGIWVNVWSDTNLNLPEFFRPSAEWFYVINCDLIESYNPQTGKPKQLFNSPTEAYEVGIEYTLNKLI